MRLDVVDHPLPERERLRVGIIDAEYRHALADPEQEHPAQLVPQRLPRVRFEIEGIDVLILLRWILGVLDRAVRPSLEPLRVLANVRVVRRALEGDVERDLHAALTRARDQPREV